MDNLPRTRVVELLNRIAKGDDSAARTLYAHYQNQIFRYAFKKTHNEADAQEITIDTLFVAFSKPHQYDGICEFSTWLCGIAKYKILDCVNQTIKRCAAEVITDEETLDSLAPPVEDVLDLVTSKESVSMIQICIDKLQPAQREAMYLTALEEDSVNEVAVKMAIPEGTVKSRLFHARLKVMRCLAAARGGLHDGGRHV